MQTTLILLLMSQIFKCKVPITRNVSPVTIYCKASAMETTEENALWDYNRIRAHDGLPPLESLPNGTTFEPVES
jgi:hypothetical protein